MWPWLPVTMTGLNDLSEDESTSLKKSFFDGQCKFVTAIFFPARCHNSFSSVVFSKQATETVSVPPIFLGELPTQFQFLQFFQTERQNNFSFSKFSRRGDEIVSVSPNFPDETLKLFQFRLFFQMTQLKQFWRLKRFRRAIANLQRLKVGKKLSPDAAL
jgi:hypothetical protein